MAQRKKSMIKDGKLDKHGKPNDKTPKDFLESYKDYSKSKPPALSGAASPNKSEDVKMEKVDMSGGDGSKKRSKEPGGSSSDEQPVKKKEKKEKKKKKKKKKETA